MILLIVEIEKMQETFQPFVGSFDKV